MSSPSTHRDSPKVPEAAVEALKEGFKQNAARCREKAADKHPGVGNICTAEAVAWEDALAALDALDRKEQEESRRVPQGSEIREVMTQRGLVEMIPVSALLSDEVVEQCWRAVFGPEPQPEDFLPELRAKARIREVLQAAIEQVGGGQGGR